MFILDFERTKDNIQKLYKNITNPSFNLTDCVKDADFLTIIPGEYLIFNPALLHGNTLNTTQHTRVSMNVRYKSIFTPEPLPEHISRSAGIFYRQYKISEWTDLAKKLAEVNIG
jgi:hypothetical protein